MPLQRTRLLPVARAGLRFDGVDDYARVAHSPSLDITSAITIAALVYPVSLPSPAPRIVSKELGALTNSYNFLIRSSDRVFCFHTDGAERVCGGSVKLNAWQHVAVAWDSVSQLPRLYVDGSLVATGGAYAGPIPSTAYDVIIGNNPTNVRQFGGLIASVLIYSRALSNEEILWNFYYPDNPVRNGLVLWLHWDSIDTASNMWYDKSGFGNHAVLYNNPVKEDVLLPPKRLLSPTRTLAPVR